MNRKDQQSAKESYEELTSGVSKSFLIDVRSRQEWFEVGVAEFLADPRKLVLCEWRTYPAMGINKNFFSELAEKLDLQAVENLYFICAAGIRSQEAATYISNKVKGMGLSINCINVSDGFNGNKNAFFSLAKANGWKASGLPYCQLDQPI